VASVTEDGRAQLVVIDAYGKRTPWQPST
jgi:hypothetical protein